MTQKGKHTIEEHHQGDLLRYAANLAGAAIGVYWLVGVILRFLGEKFIRVFSSEATLDIPLKTPEIALALVWFVLATCALLAAIFFLRAGAVGPLKTRLCFRRVNDSRIWLFLPVIVAIGLLGSVLTGLLQKLFIWCSAYVPPTQVMIPNGLLALMISFLTLCAVPAVLEEIFIRGILQSMFSRWGVWFSIVLSSALFTLLHGDVAQMPSVFVLSVLFGLSAHITGSLFPGILFHFANNTLAFIIQFANQKTDGLSAVVFLIFGIFIMCVIAACAIGIIIKGNVLKTFKPIPKMNDAKNHESRVRRLATSPLFFCMMIALTVRAFLPMFIIRTP